MRTAERPLGNERCVTAQFSCHGMHLSCLQALGQGKRRQDTGQAFGHHRLSTARRTDHNEIVSSGGSHLKGAFHILLSFDISIIQFEIILLGIKLLTGIHHHGLRLLCAVEQSDHLHDVFQAINFEIVDDSRLPGVVRGHDESLEMFLSGPDGDGQCSPHGFQFPVQSQFPHHHILVEVVGGYFAMSRQHPHCDGQVIAAALLADVSR